MSLVISSQKRLHREAYLPVNHADSKVLSEAICCLVGYLQLERWVPFCYKQVEKCNVSVLFLPSLLNLGLLVRKCFGCLCGRLIVLLNL